MGCVRIFWCCHLPIFNQSNTATILHHLIFETGRSSSNAFDLLCVWWEEDGHVVFIDSAAAASMEILAKLDFFAGGIKTDLAGSEIEVFR